MSNFHGFRNSVHRAVAMLAPNGIAALRSGGFYALPFQVCTSCRRCAKPLVAGWASYRVLNPILAQHRSLSAPSQTATS